MDCAASASHCLAAAAQASAILVAITLAPCSESRTKALCSSAADSGDFADIRVATIAILRSAPDLANAAEASSMAPMQAFITRAA